MKIGDVAYQLGSHSMHHLPRTRIAQASFNKQRQVRHGQSMRVNETAYIPATVTAFTALFELPRRIQDSSGGTTVM
jgi:hypothetical protein